MNSRHPAQLANAIGSFLRHRRISTLRRSWFDQEGVREDSNAAPSKIESGGWPEKIAENDYLMKFVMLVILIACTMLISIYQNLSQRLIGILRAITKNPRNLNFNQHIFESVSALIRYVYVATSLASLLTFEKNLFGPFTIILQQDINR
ncbi:CSE1_2 [Sanghuangporus weigelae]